MVLGMKLLDIGGGIAPPVLSPCAVSTQPTLACVTDLEPMIKCPFIVAHLITWTPAILFRIGNNRTMDYR